MHRRAAVEEQRRRLGAALLRLQQGLQAALPGRHRARVARGRARGRPRGGPRQRRGARGPEGRARRARRRSPVGDNGKEPPAPDRWWVVLDRPALSGTDLKNPEQNFDQRGGGQPIVTFDFTDKGLGVFQDITRTIAQRGADSTLPGVPAEQASQHFAIVLDDELVSSPFINFQENPDGIDGSTSAQISGGFTIQSAQDLAKILKIGALPIKLELISRSQVSASSAPRRSTRAWSRASPAWRSSRCS